MVAIDGVWQSMARVVHSWQEEGGRADGGTPTTSVGDRHCRQHRGKIQSNSVGGKGEEKKLFTKSCSMCQMSPFQSNLSLFGSFKCSVPNTSIMQEYGVSDPPVCKVDSLFLTPYRLIPTPS